MLICEKCDKCYKKPSGWGLDICLDCFHEGLKGFVEEMAKEPAVENIVLHDGKRKIVVKGEDNGSS